MRYSKKTRWLLSLILVQFFFFQERILAEASKNTDAHGASDEAHGAQAEGASAKEGPKKDSWSDVSARVQGIRAKINSKQEILKKLLEDKNKQTDEAKKNEMVRAAIKEHQELQTLIKEYDKERVYLKFGFPEGGQKSDAKYKRIESKKLEELDQEVSLQSKLDQSMRILRKQYKLENLKSEEPEMHSEALPSEKYPIFDPKIIQK